MKCHLAMDIKSEGLEHGNNLGAVLSVTILGKRVSG